MCLFKRCLLATTSKLYDWRGKIHLSIHAHGFDFGPKITSNGLSFIKRSNSFSCKNTCPLLTPALLFLSGSISFRNLSTSFANMQLFLGVVNYLKKDSSKSKLTCLDKCREHFRWFYSRELLILVSSSFYRNNSFKGTCLQVLNLITDKIYQS